MSFYVDAGDQREKARRLEQTFLEHEARRPYLRQQGVIRPPDEIELPDSGIVVNPNAPIRQPDYEDHVPSTAPDKYAARFRDGLPPPPPPQRITGDVLADPRSRPPRRLIPQEEIDQGRGDRSPQQRQPAPIPPQALTPPPSYDEAALSWDRAFPDAEYTAYLVPPFEDVMQQPEQLSTAALSPSQKKRLRRKKAKLRSRENGAAPFPLKIDQPKIPIQIDYRQYPEEPPHPPVQTRCDAEVMLQMPDGTLHTLLCPLTPFPHPGQPHLVQLASPTPQTDVFVGFWLPGE